MRFWLRIHFRRVFVSGTDKVPATGPVILACNHPNSFLDAIVVALLLKRPVNFLVRSDVFRKPAARWILGKLKMIPIYRLQEGVENLEKNQGTFKLCTDILSRGEVLLIFSEGNCVLEKRLRSLKKGTARIVFGAEESKQWNLHVNVVPVGINYAKPTLFRTELMVSFGNKFTATDLKETFEAETAKAIRLFNERLSPAMLNELLIIPEKEQDYPAETALELGRTIFRYPVFFHKFNDGERLRTEQKWLKKLFQSNTVESSVSFSQFGEKTEKINIPLKASVPYLWKGNMLIVILGFPLAAAGFIIHLVPTLLTRNISKKTDRSPKFRSSVVFGAGALFSYVWYLILTLVIALINYRLLPVILLFLWLGWIALIWWEALQQRRRRIQYHLFKRAAPAAFENWIDERDELLGMLH